MPSRTISPSPTPSSTPQLHPNNLIRTNLVPPLAAATAAAFSLLIFLITLYRKITRKRTAPADSKPPHRFSYSTLRRATDSFSPSRRLGQGGFGSVYHGVLPENHKEIAVKVMDSGSLQGEREFQNEIFFAAKIDSSSIVSVVGFCSDQRRGRMLLVYELMQNGNLQDALLHRKCAELMEWKKRFSVAIEIAKGLDYLHGLDPPVIHGDIKPSNVLLDRYFSARIGDFGLAKLKYENNQFDSDVKVNIDEEEEEKKKKTKKNEDSESHFGGVEECGSVVEESESVTTGFEDGGIDQSPENLVQIHISGTSMETMEGASDGSRTVLGKDWWWKQENGGGKSGKVKDYVMEWIGSEIKQDRPNKEWIVASSSSGINRESEKKKNKRRLEWWMSMEDEKNPKTVKKEKRRPAREWWKEEYCEELAKKRKKKKKKKKKKEENETSNSAENGDDFWPVDEELYRERKKKSRSGSRGSKGSIDWWLEGLSGELWRGRKNSYDSGEIPKSGCISSTPSMRGTMCYIAPEYGGGDYNLSEKCDVYSYGVLLLVLISGRRPLQVTNSPLSEFQRANLLSWARRLCRAGKLIELVDQSIQSLDKDQAILCIKIALLCLQKLPARRPSMEEVVSMLCNGMELPPLPSELSPSPPSRYPGKMQRKVR